MKVVSDHVSINYPDILGAITGGPRLNLDVIQCAVAVRPSPVPAGQPFDLILLVQNASDIDVDILVIPNMPEQDTAKHKERFTTKSPRVRVGLRPAEVGFVSVSVLTSPITQPGPNYTAGFHLEIKRMEKKVQRVRTTGGPFVVEELPEAARAHVQTLRALHFSADPSKKKNAIQVEFQVNPPALTSLKALKEQKTEWISLWTLRDYMDDYTIAQKVWGPAQELLKQLRRETVFMPLLKTTQEHFQACHYPLTPPEAICVTKLLTLLLETGVASPSPAAPRPSWPRWFTRLCRLLFQEPGLANQIEPLVTRLLYNDLLFDTVLYGFTMVATVTNENFGSPEETSHYAEDIVESLNQHRSIDLARAYLPLVMGGLIATARVTMPREQIRETVFMLSKAVEKRRPEKNQENTFIFDLMDKLIERALDSA